MREGAPSPRWPRLAPHHSSLFPSPRRGTGRGRTLRRTGAWRQWTHGRTHACPEEVLCCTPPSSFSSPALHLHGSVLNAPLLTTRSFDVARPLAACCARAHALRAWRRVRALGRLCVCMLLSCPHVGGDLFRLLFCFCRRISFAQCGENVHRRTVLRRRETSGLLAFCNVFFCGRTLFSALPLVARLSRRGYQR